MDNLLAAYGSPISSSNSNNKPKKLKSKDGVVNIKLSISKLDEKDKKDIENIISNDNKQSSLTGKRKITSIEDILPSPKSKKQKISHNKPQSLIAISKIKKSSENTEETQEETNSSFPLDNNNIQDDIIGPQMPSEQELEYYQSYYQENTEEKKPEILSDLADCPHIPELERSILIGKKRRGEEPVFIGINQDNLRKITDWDRESNEHYRVHAALNAHNSVMKGGNQQKNQITKLVNNALTNADVLDSRLARIRQSKAQVRAKYGW